MEAEFDSGVSEIFISGLFTMRAQNINYYTHMMKNASDDFSFEIIPLAKMGGIQTILRVEVLMWNFPIMLKIQKLRINLWRI
ncbi:MAG TPA: hypothetical protein H9829_10005 [Candidatus Tetragenococcus pullicola]|nr:hypothetical protein [Candidatus Tetragenococcus pullicola]